MSDLRLACRQLLKHPGFTAVAVLTLALGIGVNTAMFSVIHGVLLKPLPYPEPGRLVTLWERSPERGVTQERVSGPNYLDWRSQNTVLEDLAVSPGWDGVEDFNLVNGDTPIKIRASYASSSLFQTLGVAPLLGRTLLPAEDLKEGNRAVVLSHGLWQRLFAGDSNVIGRSLTLDTYGRRDYTIVGVMPPGFGLPSRNELWLPLGWMGVSLDQRREAHWHQVIARLKPGVTPARAEAELSAIQARIRQAHPGMAIGSAVTVVPLVEQALGRNLHLGLKILWGVVTGVLLIACANLANLLLARAGGRQREMAVRLALGSGRWRIARQLLTESLLLAAAGGAAGALLGGWGLRLVVAASPQDIPRLSEVTLDGTALGFTALVSLVTGLLFGLAPAWIGSRTDLGEALKDTPRGSSSGATVGRLRSLLMVSEVALSLVLLVGAGLMLRSLAHMLRAERGFEPAHLTAVRLDYSVSGFTTWIRPDGNRPQVSQRELMERVRTLPGVQAVGAGSRLLRRENHPPNEALSLFGKPEPDPGQMPRAHFSGISPGWISALGLRLQRGRDFTEADTLESAGVVIVNETFARRHFPDTDPVGQHLKMGAGQPPLGATNRWGQTEWSRIVGVVSDVKSLHAQPDAVPEVYAPYWQWPMQAPSLLIRSSSDPAVLAAAIRREAQSVIPNLPPPEIHTLDELIASTVAQPRLQTTLLGLFGLLALALTTVGLYGVMALLVGQRTRELGIRMALGARRHHLMTLVLGRGLRLVAAGIGVGLLASIALTRVMRQLLYGVAPWDPLTLAGVACLLLGVATLACWIPARRAASADPMTALREE